VAGIQGQLIAEQIAGELNAQGVSHISANVAGDVSITFASGLGPSNVKSSGDIVCRFAPDANATVHISSASSNISVNMPGAGRTIEEGAYELKLGNGDVPINLDASGDVTVVSKVPGAEPGRHEFPFDFDFDFDFDAEGGPFGAQWGAFGERIAQRAREAAERAAANVQAKVQAKVERATRKAEEQARRAETRARRHGDFGNWAGRRMNFEGGWRVERPTPPPPPGEPVSDEERMTILRMLEQKKITVEQAEQLLAALAGKGTEK
jgi:hypothetical protein